MSGTEVGPIRTAAPTANGKDPYAPMNRIVARTATREAAKRLGTHLRGLRNARAWTQRQVADEVEVDSVTLRRWELGMFSPSQENMERLATLFGVGLESLMQVVSAPEAASGEAAVPIRGYVDAGTPRTDYDVDLGVSGVPCFLVESYGNAFLRVVSGDSLTLDGIHDSDMLLVSPDGEPCPGRICILQLGTVYCGAVFVPGIGYRWRTPSGRTENLSSEEVAFTGNVVGHIRRM